MDAYSHIARHLHKAKDIVTLSTLCKTTYEAVAQDTRRRWTLSFTANSVEKGAIAWLESHPAFPMRLTFSRCLFSPAFQFPPCTALESLVCTCCRVVPSAFDLLAPTLRSLTIHQICVDMDPGSLAPVLNKFPLLEHVSLSFCQSWGIVVIGPLELPHLQTLRLRNAHVLLLVGMLPSTLQTLALSAYSVTFDTPQPLPHFLDYVEVQVVEDFVDFATLFSDPLPHLTTCRFRTLGLVSTSFLRQCPALTSLVGRCDSLLVGPHFSASLGTLDIDVTTCYVCEPMDAEAVVIFRTIPSRRTMERGRVIDLDRFLEIG